MKNIAIKAEQLSKCYQIYTNPRDRLKQFIYPRFQRLLGLKPKKYYREFWALKNISFEVRKSETVGIIGYNGSGKSTLLQMICETLNPTQGNVVVDGRVSALLELGSGFNPDFTGRENVYLNASILGLNKDFIDSKFEDIAKFADIDDFIEQPVKTYSSGMMVRLAFSVAVAVDPDVLVVDEALAVGDELFQRKCFARINEIKKRGGTILFVSHDTQLILEMCDRTVLLNNGESIFFGNTKRAVDLYYSAMGKTQTEEPNINDHENDKTLQSVNKNSEANKDKFEIGENISQTNYDEKLSSPTQHTIHNKEFGVHISGIKLINNNGQKVNILDQNSRYIVQFEVEFARNPKNISYQVLIKTVNGMPIAGNRFFHEKTFSKEAQKGSKRIINYEFQCLMNAGVYFISIESCGDENGQNVVFHKFAEVITFRVINKQKINSIGYLSLIPQINMQEI